MHSPLIIPAVRGSRLSGRASPQLADVLERMLQKNRDSRISLEELWRHPFWRGALSDLSEQQLQLPQTPPHVTTAFTGSKQRMNAPADATEGGELSGGAGNSCASLTMSAADDASFVLHLGSRADSGAATGAPLHNDGDVERPLGVVEDNEKSASTPNVPAELQQLVEIATSSANDGVRARAAIDDYGRMMKDGRAKFDGKLLAIAPFSVVKLRAMRKAERDKHLRQVRHYR